MDTVTPAFSDAVKAAARAAGANLSDAAADALVTALDSDPANHFLSRYVAEPNTDLVAARVATFLKAKPPTAEERASAYPETFGVHPDAWAKLSPLNRLTIARQAQAKGQAKAAPKSFATKRIESELHAARLRVNSLYGEDRAKAVQRVAALESELAEVRAR